MKTTIIGKNMNVSPAVSERVLRKTDKMGRYLDQNAEMTVHLTREKNHRRTCEITVPIEGVVLRSEAGSEDNLYIAIDQALAKMERQIYKHRAKLSKRLRDDAFQNPELEFTEEIDLQTESKRKIVRTKTFPVRPMSVDDAIFQMDLLGHSFFVFVNADTNQSNVLYLRKDGDLGLLEPEE